MKWHEGFGGRTGVPELAFLSVLRLCGKIKKAVSRSDAGAQRLLLGLEEDNIGTQVVGPSSSLRFNSGPEPLARLHVRNRMGSHWGTKPTGSE